MASVSADLELSLDAALASVDALEARITEATSGVSVDVEADIAAASAAIDGLEAAPIEVPVEADVAAAQGEVDSITVDPIEVQVDADVASAEAGIESLGDSAAGAGGDVSGLSEQFGGLTESIGDVSFAGSDLLGTIGSLGLGATGIGALTAAGLSFVDSFGEAEAAAERVGIIIDNTGGAAGVTADEVASLATEIQGYSHFSDEAILSGASLVLGFENIRNAGPGAEAIFTRLIKVGADYAAFTDSDVTAATQRFGRALNDPVRGMSLLRRAGILFTAEQQALVTSLVESGDTVGAQDVLISSLEHRYQGTAERLGELTSGAVPEAKEAFDELAETLGSSLAPGFTNTVHSATGLIGTLDALVGKLGDLPGIGEGGTEFGLSDIIENATPLALIDNLRDALGGLGDDNALHNLIISGREFDDTLDPLAGKSDELRASLDGVAGAGGDVDSSFDQMAESMSKVDDLASNLRDSLDELFGAQQSVDEGAIDVRERQRALVASLVDLDGAYVAGSESGDRFLTTAQGLAGAVRDQTIRLLESGAGADVARLAQFGYIDGLRRTLTQAGLTDAQIEELIDTYATVPERRITQFETPGMSQARAGAKGLKGDIDSIPKHPSIHVSDNASEAAGHFNTLRQSIDDAIAAASGGQSLLAAHLAVSGDTVGPSGGIHHGPESASRVAVRSTPAPVTESGGGHTVIINTTVDARGAQDPAAVVSGVNAAQEDHRRRIAIQLHQR